MKRTLCTAAAALMMTLGAANADAAPSPADPVNVYIDTANCSDSNAGTTQKPLCTLNGASKAIDKMHKAGNARGDVYVRFKTDRSQTYQVKSSAGANQNRFTFAPEAGRRVYIVPDWYRGRNAMYSSPRANYAVIKGNGGTGGENFHGITIIPDKNRGGSYTVSGLTIQDFKNGILINGGALNKDEKDPIEPTKGVVRGAMAPISNPTVEYNAFDRIGDPYSKSEGYAMGVLRIWNTTDGQFNDNYVSNVRGANELHVVYGYVSSNLTIRRNTLTNIDAGATFRYRHGGNWNVSDHSMPSSGLRKNNYGHVSQWIQNSKFEDNGRYAECQYADAQVKNMDAWDIRNRKYDQQSWCTDPARVFPPQKLVGQQVAKDQYRLNWEPATTNSSSTKISSYEIYVNDVHVGTVGAGTRKFTITTSVLSKGKGKPGQEFSYTVVAVSDQSTKSSRTANKSMGTIDPGRTSSGQNVSSSVDTSINGRLPHVPLGKP